MAQLGVEVRGLTKRYGDVQALDDVSFDAGEGEIVGLVGPNGAGKTTALECVSGLRRADRGTVRLFGLDPASDQVAVAKVLGVQLQEAQLPERLRVAEAVALYAAFYDDPADGDALLEEFGLAESRRTAFAALSGGQRQRLAIVLALIGNPRAVVLDELTTGLDPQARRATWDVVTSLRSRGLTIVLSTHYMEEAQRLCDRVAVIDNGRVVAFDSPAGIVAGIASAPRIIVDLTDTTAQLPASFSRLGRVTTCDGSVVIEASPSSVARVMRAVERSGLAYRSMRVETVTLEDAYLSLTGQGARPAETSR